MTVLLSLFLLCLFVAPTCRSNCYDILCASSTGYLSRDSTSFEIFLSPLSTDEVAVCVSKPGDAAIFCERDDLNRMTIPSTNHSDAILRLDHATFSIDNAKPDTANRKSLFEREYHIKKIPFSPVAVQIFLLKPSYGVILSNFLNISFDFALSGNLRHFTTFSAYFNVDGILSQKFPLDSKTISAKAIEPGSWFFSLTPQIFTNEHDDPLDGYTAFGYFEFILTPEQIRQERIYSQHDYDTSSELDKAIREIYIDGSSRPKNICLWGANKLDGQKNIWIQQVEHINPLLYTFTWILSSLVENNHLGTVRHRLLGAKNVRLVISPFHDLGIPFETLSQVPDDGGLSAADVWGESEEKLYRYVGTRFRLAGGVVENVSPPWIRELYVVMREHMLTEQCDLVVYGNDRGFNSDVLIRDTARVLGIPTVTELLNLFLDPELVPDVIVAPSTYAAEHRSIAGLRHAAPVTAASPEALSASPRSEAPTAPTYKEASRNSAAGSATRPLKGPRVVVIPPSVDLRRFNISEASLSPVVYHHSCTAQQVVANRQQQHQQQQGANNTTNNCSLLQQEKPLQLQNTDVNVGIDGSGHREVRDMGDEAICITIGFVARLSPEKNPGLFLLAAHKILKLVESGSQALIRLHFHFVMIGDGVLRDDLEELVTRLHIAHAVTFTGWVGPDQLPRVLAGIAIVVNPSLRAWSETFCIANIEAMSMGTALVTFGVGGIGEYIGAPSDESDFKNREEGGEDTFNNRKENQFTVTSNAVLVNEATPDAIAAAVLALSENCTLRSQISTVAQETVKSYFQVERQMRQYITLYDSLT